MIATLELDHRLRRAGHAVAYLVVSLPVTLLAWPAVALLVIGAALSVLGIGLPLVVAGAGACRALARLDRRAANRWLDAQVPRTRVASAAARARCGAPWTCSTSAACGGWRPSSRSGRCWPRR